MCLVALARCRSAHETCSILYCLKYGVGAWVWGGPCWELLPEGKSTWFCWFPVLSQQAPSWITKKPAQLQLTTIGPEVPKGTNPFCSLCTKHTAQHPNSLLPMHSTRHLVYLCSCKQKDLPNRIGELWQNWHQMHPPQVGKDKLRLLSCDVLQLEASSTYDIKVHVIRRVCQIAKL